MLYNPEILEFLGKEGKLDYIDCIDEITKKRMHVKTTEEIYFNYEEALKELKETLYLEETCQKISPKLWKNYDFVREAIKINGTLIKYADEELSLNTIAEHVNFSPNHLSTVFSKQTGQTFIKYLTDFRMTKAKELLRCTGKRSSEISIEVGYRDPHYFAYLFKKTQGMTPTQYRGGRGGEEE